MTSLVMSLLVTAVMAGATRAEVTMEPFTMDWRDDASPLVDLSVFLDTPAGKGGFVGTKDGHLATADGRRFRIWGVQYDRVCLLSIAPGFDLALTLMHATRIRDFNTPGGLYPSVNAVEPIISDTGELVWHHSGKRQGFVVIQTDRSQGLIGFAGRAREPLRNLAATVDNEFCAILLTALDGKPVAQAHRLLLVATARSANTGMKWNDKRTSLTDWGTAPSVIEPVTGSVTLRSLGAVERIEVIPLDSGAKSLGQPVIAERAGDGWRIPLGRPATPWYLLRLTHGKKN